MSTASRFIASVARGAFYMGLMGIGLGIVTFNIPTIIGGIFLAIVGRFVADNLPWTSVVSVLSKAVERNDTEEVERSLQNGESANSYGEWSTVLGMAACNGQLRIVEILLTAGADPNLADRWGNTPLHWAAQRGHLPVVEVLLRANVNPNVLAVGGFGDSALYRAADGGHAEVIPVLLQAGADPNLGPSALQAVLSKGNIDTARMLLAAGANPTPGLDAACKLGSRELVRELLARGIVPSERTMICAAANGDPEIVTMILDRGAKPDWGLTAAINNRRPHIVELLLNAGANVNGAGSDNEVNTPLTSAAIQGDTQIVRMLLDAGADRSAKDFRGHTALKIAKKARHEEIVKLLI